MLRADDLVRDGDCGPLKLIDLAGRHPRNRCACFDQTVCSAERREVGGD